MSTTERAEAQAIGRPRGGRTTKVHAVCDEAGRLRRFTVTGDNRPDVTQADALLTGDVPAVLADKGP